MASGLFALLDDIAAIAKVAAASVDDIGTISELLLGLCQRFIWIQRAVPAKGVVIDIHDPHHQRTAWELDHMLSGLPNHTLGQLSGR